MNLRGAAVIYALSLILAAQQSAGGALALNGLFGDGMVLQRDQPIPVWGTATPGAEVAVAFRGQTVVGKTGADGRWSVALEAEKAGGPDGLTVSTPDGQVTAKDVFVGEVWLASGQSNMALTVDKLIGENAPAAEVTDPMFRFFTVGTKADSSPATDISGQWMSVTPATIRRMSAVAYFFGAELRAKLGVPVGVIISSVGGTPASAWISLEGFSKAPAAKGFFMKLQEDAEAQYPGKKAIYELDLAAFNERKKQAAAAGVPFPEKMRRPPVGAENPKRPGALFNGMIHPLIPFSIRGFIWYQGEQDAIADRVGFYPALLRAMILDWRTRWGRRHPFLIVQLPAFRRDINWARMQQAQREVACDPGNGLVVTIDLGEEKDIHPRNKRPVGMRLARLALAEVHGLALHARAPEPVAISREGSEVRVRFVVDGGGGLVTKPDGSPMGFELSGADGVYVTATARVEGDAIVLRSTVADPKGVRYAYSDWPELGVFDSEGLPAGPFVLPVPWP